MRLNESQMETVSQLVERFESRIVPCSPPYRESTTELEFTYMSFGAAVKQLESPVSEVATALESLHDETIQNRIDLWLMAACQIPDASFVIPLCKLLGVRNRYMQHEWIAELLGDIGDPRAIQPLIETCGDSWEFDASGFVQHRCIDSLLRISTPESIDAVRKLAESDLESVREYAIMALGENSGQPDSAA